MGMMEPFRIAPSAVATMVGDETVILDVASGTYFGLGPVGSRIWQCVAAGKGPHDICELLLNDYDVSPDDVERDIAELLQDLCARGLIARP